MPMTRIDHLGLYNNAVQHFVDTLGHTGINHEAAGRTSKLKINERHLLSIINSIVG